MYAFSIRSIELTCQTESLSTVHITPPDQITGQSCLSPLYPNHAALSNVLQSSQVGQQDYSALNVKDLTLSQLADTTNCAETRDRLQLAEGLHILSPITIETAKRVRGTIRSLQLIVSQVQSPRFSPPGSGPQVQSPQTRQTRGRS